MSTFKSWLPTSQNCPLWDTSLTQPYIVIYYHLCDNLWSSISCLPSRKSSLWTTLFISSISTTSGCLTSGVEDEEVVASSGTSLDSGLLSEAFLEPRSRLNLLANFMIDTLIGDQDQFMYYDAVSVLGCMKSHIVTSCRVGGQLARKQSLVLFFTDWLLARDNPICQIMQSYWNEK